MNAHSGNKKSRLRDYIDERKWERVSEWERNKIYFTQALFAASYEVKNLQERERGGFEILLPTKIDFEI